jgi:hypothetical protein
MKHLPRVLWLAALLASRVALAADAAALEQARQSIAEDDLRRHVDLLADDAYEGREAGSRGGRAIGAYLAREFQRLELAGGGTGGGYFQEFRGNCRNVLGLLPGGDPALEREVVVLGAHYDHVGYGNSQNSYGPLGRIHNGADDNASGTSALLEVIEAFHALSAPPRRSVLFAFWDGEEQGLWGSQHWVDNPTLPLDRVRLAINADMVGRLRNERLEVYGTRTAPGLRELLARANALESLRLDCTWEMKENSDHWSFYARSVPTVMLHTGLHEDYHRPSDDADKVNVEGMQRVARMMFELTRQAADADTLPAFRPASRRETVQAQQASQQPAPPVPGRFGVHWDTALPPDGGLTVVRVAPGSAAQMAGLRPGDRIVRFAGQEVRDPEVFRRLVLGAPPDTAVAVVRAPGSEPLELPVRLTGEPIRIGVTWREDDAEPGTVILTRVVPGSPAATAGLHLGDRVYRAAGERFAGGEEFRRLLTLSASPLELEVERAGRITSISLEPLEVAPRVPEESSETP